MRSRTARAEMFVEPVERAAQRVDAILGHAEAVALALVHVVLVLLAAVAQRFHDLLGFALRDAWIVRALQDEKRRANLGCMRERRAVAVQLRVLHWVPELADEIIAQIAARRLVHRLPRDHAHDRDAPGKTIGP